MFRNRVPETPQTRIHNFNVKVEDVFHRSTLPYVPLEDVKSRTEETPKVAPAPRKGGRGGNNTYGNKGTRKCQRCRQLKCKCKYDQDQPEEPCERCSKTGTKCGPKRWTKEDRQHCQTTSGNQTINPLDTSHELDFDADLLPQILALFPSERLDELANKLYREVEAKSKEKREGDSQPNSGRDFVEFRTKFDWQDPETLSECPLSRQIPRDISDDQVQESWYHLPTAAPFNFDPSISRPLQFPFQEYGLQTPITNSQETFYDAASQQRDGLHTGFQMTPMGISGRHDVNRYFPAPHLSKTSHPTYPAGPVQRGGGPSRPLPTHNASRPINVTAFDTSTDSLFPFTATTVQPQEEVPDAGEQFNNDYPQYL